MEKPLNTMEEEQKMKSSTGLTREADLLPNLLMELHCNNLSVIIKLLLSILDQKMITSRLSRTLLALMIREHLFILLTLKLLNLTELKFLKLSYSESLMSLNLFIVEHGIKKLLQNGLSLALSLLLLNSLMSTLNQFSKNKDQPYFCSETKKALKASLLMKPSLKLLRKIKVKSFSQPLE